MPLTCTYGHVFPDTWKVRALRLASNYIALKVSEAIVDPRFEFFSFSSLVKSIVTTHVPEIISFTGLTVPEYPFVKYIETAVVTAGIDAAYDLSIKDKFRGWGMVTDTLSVTIMNFLIDMWVGPWLDSMFVPAAPTVPGVDSGSATTSNSTNTTA